MKTHNSITSRGSKLIASISISLMSISVCDAALVERDLFTASDALLTLDTETNLAWLDLTYTTDQSYNSIVTGDFAGLISTYGFRYATNAEVNELILNAGAPNPPPGPFNPWPTPPVPGVQTLLDHLGCTINCDSANPGARGILPEGSGLIEYVWFLNDGYESDPFILGFDGSEPTTGNFLVRAVPVPGALGLFIAGLLGLLTFSRSRNAT